MAKSLKQKAHSIADDHKTAGARSPSRDFRGRRLRAREVSSRAARPAIRSMDRRTDLQAQPHPASEAASVSPERFAAIPASKF